MKHPKLSLDKLNRINVEEFKETPKTPLIIILDNIRSFHNVGSVFRTADAFLVEKIYLCGFTPAPPHRDIQKTALGATESVSWEYAEDIFEVIKKLKQGQVEICAVEQTQNATFLDNYIPEQKKIALVFGNEVTGVQQEVINQCHSVIEIPQFGTKHSLNISVSSGIVLWDLWTKIK